MAYVEVDIEDYLDEVSDNVIKSEYERRLKKKNPTAHIHDISIPRIVAIETADEASRILRRVGRPDLAYKMDEIRIDYLEPAA